MKNSILCTLALTLCATAAVAQQSTTAPANALPDAPSVSANIHAPLQPTGPTVVMDTTKGRITCKLFTAQAPRTSQNFLDLAEGRKDWTDPATHRRMHAKPLYDGTIFHRVIPGFMAQGGDPSGTGLGGAGYYFTNEVSPALNFDKPGRLAMANSGPNTNSSQFFITVAEVQELNGNYNIFGQCDDASLAVVRAITEVARDDADKPFRPIVLQKLTVVRDGQPMPPLPNPAATAQKPASHAIPGPAAK